ncbi:MAG: two pore domain potassium channel family protein [Candidatus Accumulibacter sp.]|nr:two pore domain potassium channel family protein [Accumulibacter sp.]
MRRVSQGLQRSTWRLLGLLISMPAAVVLFGSVFMVASEYLEGKPMGFWSSLEWASETLTTTGYGAYAPWQHPLMIVFVILTQFVGMFFLVLVPSMHLRVILCIGHRCCRWGQPRCLRRRTCLLRPWPPGPVPASARQPMACTCWAARSGWPNFACVRAVRWPASGSVICSCACATA